MNRLLKFLLCSALILSNTAILHAMVGGCIPQEHTEQVSDTPNFEEELFIAIRAGDEQNILNCLRHGVDVNIRNTDNMPALITAIHYAQSRIAGIFLLQPTIDVNSACARDGFTALMTATALENMPMIHTLLAHANINVNARDRRNVSALAIAIGQDALEIVCMLLAHRNATGNFDTIIDEVALSYATPGSEIHRLLVNALSR